MSLLTRKRQVAIEQEAVEGTAETLVAGDVQFLVEELDSSFAPEVNERNPLRETLSREGVVPGAKLGTINGRTELKQRNSGDAVTTPPPMVDVLLASGHAAGQVKTATMDATIGAFVAGERLDGDAGTPCELYYISGEGGTTLTYALRAGAQDIQNGETVTGLDSAVTSIATTPAPTQIGLAYYPVSSGVPSFTVADYMDGVVTTLFGARCNGGINCERAGAIGYMTFAFEGKALAPVDAALFTGTSVPNIVPETFLSAGVKAHGDLLCVDSFNLDFARQLARRPCANQPTGIISHRITDRLPVITIDPERELEATVDFFAKFDAATQFGFTATIGQSAGKKTIVVAGRCQYSELSNADREGIATLGASLRCNAASSGGDDEYFICFV